MNKTILITGAAGFLGSHLCEYYVNKGLKVFGLDNLITGDYLDFSLDKNLMLISRDVVLKNNENSLHADAIEMDIKKGDIKIFMYEDSKKVNIKTFK